MVVSLACSDDAADHHPAGEATAETDIHAASKSRLAAFEDHQRATTDFERRPASDHRFGSDPVRLIALPDGRFAGLLRGLDRVVVLDEQGMTLAELATPHLPTGLALAPGLDTLAIVGIGEPSLQVVDITIDADQRVALVERDRIDLGPEALSPRDLAFSSDRVWIVDEGTQALFTTTWPPREPVSFVAHPHCRGPIELRVVGELMLTNCLLDHSVRIDMITPGWATIDARATITHDGPIWAFDVQAQPNGDLRLALAGVEDRPLDRLDGGFGYIDSFVFLARYDAATQTVVREAAINVSELGLVTPKSILFGAGEHQGWIVDVTGYASAERLRLHGSGDALTSVDRHAWLPGTQSLVRLERAGSTTWLAANPLLDAWLLDARMIGASDRPPTRIAVADDRDDRSFEERLGEALVFTTAMAPDNSSEDKRSRFTCETCHFEGRGDGRIHWTGRGEVHATSKTLLGLFENRPHFSRALDKTMAVMVDNEFRVANRHGPRDPWAPLGERDLPWLVELPGWSGEVDGESLRRSLMAFLIRWTLPSNPRARARVDQPEFEPLEARGAELFRDHCESCHEARLVADDSTTRVTFDRWPALVLSESGPIVWASEIYAATGIRPWVHELGARVPSLRRLHLDGPYFTNGAADSVAAVLAGVRFRSDPERRVDHDLAGSPGEPLATEEQRALLAFLQLL
jgi:hypothetical protein